MKKKYDLLSLLAALKITKNLFVLKRELYSILVKNNDVVGVEISGEEEIFLV